MSARIFLIFIISSLVSVSAKASNAVKTDTAKHEQSINYKKKVLIITDEKNDLSLPATAEARELDNLLGHFKTTVSIQSINQYTENEINKYDILFFIGYNLNDKLGPVFMNDVARTKKTVVWINSGLLNFSKTSVFRKKFGFSVVKLDSSGTYDVVKSGNKTFTRTNDDIFIVRVLNKSRVNVLATSWSDSLQRKVPYIIQNKNFYYVADMPFINTSPSGRYLLFADMLHEMVGENHPVSHLAIARIEDVTPVRNPQRLRAIADIFSKRHIPFLIGVIPFYVDPAKNIRISLSDRPELVEALKYCVEKGATIVMHGVTHQYKGVSAVDFEFWDGNTYKPIANDNPEDIANKIETGINECVKNGIYPLVWETPHYCASVSDYKVISKYFSTVVERRLVNNDYDFGQFYPYVIHKDIYGETIYPEDLGYIPLLDSRDSSEMYVHQMISNAQDIYRDVRDGYASFFFHPFLKLDYLKEIVDKISKLGFSFVDLRQKPNWVKSKEVVILSGSQSYRMRLNHAFLDEIYYNKNGEIEKNIVSTKLMNGFVSKKIMLKPDEFYIAEPIKHHPGQGKQMPKGRHS
jgi:uncharacterized protein YdaL